MQIHCVIIMLLITVNSSKIKLACAIIWAVVPSCYLCIKETLKQKAANTSKHESQELRKLDTRYQHNTPNSCKQKDENWGKEPHGDTSEEVMKYRG